MAEGLEVTINYRGAKYNRVASPATSSSKFAILKKDLAHLRVHSPSQRNVRHVNGSFILHWPSAGMSPKDSLHSRWSKLCSDDPEALKLREFLSIESITLTQDGVLIRSTSGAEIPSQDAPLGSFAGSLSDCPLPEVAPRPAPMLVLNPVARPQIPLPPKPPPVTLRSDRQPLQLKRRMSSVEGRSSSIRRKLDPPLQSINTELQPTRPTTSSSSNRQPESSTPRDAMRLSPQLLQDVSTPSSHTHAPTLLIPPDPQTTPSSPPREPGEMTPRTPLIVPTPVTGRSPSGPGLAPRPFPLHQPALSTPASASPYPGSTSSGDGDSDAARRRERNVSRLMRELWDTHRQMTAIQSREQVILDDLERLGARPDSARRDGVSQDELLRLEGELKSERGRRVRAEQALSDVERECRTPFVVPALFQAFMSISELSN